MRISTAMMHQAVSGLLGANSAALSKTQEQVSTGRRIVSPSDDPGGAVHVLELRRALDESAQFGSNATRVTNRLSMEESALADATDAMQRAHELAVQANSSTLDPSSRRMIATELQQLKQQLLDVANRRDEQGTYLFSGFSGGTQPFAWSGGAAQFLGDQGVRLVQTGPSQRIADGHSGFEVFMSVPAGNGTFVTDAGAANTGSGIIDPGSVTDPTAWTPGDYTITFTAPGAWQVTDASNAVVANGAYSPGDTIAFRGVQVRLTGQPATSDTFSVSGAGRTDVFAPIQRLIDALAQPQGNDAARAQFASTMAGAIRQLDGGIDHLATIRGDVGARLAALEQGDGARQDYEHTLQKTLSQVQDLDYATALTKMNQQMTALQATQQSYSKIAQLSLFNYL